MMYKGKLYNGKSSKSHTATVTWDYRDQLKITYETITVQEDLEVIVNNSFTYEKIDTIELITKGLVQIIFDDFPHPILEVDDINFYKELKEKDVKIDGDLSFYHIFNSPLKALGLGVTFLAAVLSFYFFAIPFLSHRLVDNLPISYDVEWGEKSAEIILDEEEINKEASLLANELFHQTGFTSEFPIEFYVVNSDIVNAYALPGGKIVLYTGLLEKMEDINELYALIGHEIGHVEQRHSSKSLVEAAAGYAILSLMLSDINGLTAVITDQLHNLNKLSYSRSMESEADEYALYFLKDVHASEEGLVHLFDILIDEYENNEVLKYASKVTFLSTHPDIHERKKNAEKEISSDQNNVSDKELMLYEDLMSSLSIE
ncbi:M48 family metallopeptidase [Flammeovirga agarivorans]|uniref:M48 family metallopeptidase n=1 Tax=Flammeovirga agarivorans TaxID=2726742 RepID=A0A7X8SNP7_9BACT|nr:M48 family metallopeptidase [Flammeovirga agarivorans]NLR93564.1 M48 family metallopeptidase [Flammeovirga agarivorans]